MTCLLRMESIDKRFPGVHALDHVDFDLREREIHVLLGENGAGKSTLMKILSGSLQRDYGRILLREREVEIASPSKSRELGVGMVYQELSLVPTLTVAENVSLGRWPRHRSGRVNWREIDGRARTILKELGLDINPRTRVSALGLAEQQLVEIARVISWNPQVILFDEPTSALSDHERDKLFDIIHRLKERGAGIIYISHRLEEIPRLADRITILRDGKKIATFEAAEVSKDETVRLMVGRELKEQFPKEPTALGPHVLEVERLNLGRRLHDVSFHVNRGEILGVFGLLGSGRTSLARALFGLEKRDSGVIRIDGLPLEVTRPVDAINAGIAYVTENRREGLVPQLSIPPNITLASLRDVSRLFVLKRRQETEMASQYVRSLRIQTPSLKQRIFRLSGGNQQKVVIAKWLCRKAKVFILDEPTRGIDVGAKAEVFQLMNRLTKQGAAILMMSSEIPEILGMADRVLVIHRGTIVSSHARGEVSQEVLLGDATGLRGDGR